MKGFLEVVRADRKNHEFVNISHIVSIVGNKIITDAVAAEYEGGGSYLPCPYVITTAHTHKELVELLNKAIEESAK